MEGAMEETTDVLLKPVGMEAMTMEDAMMETTDVRSRRAATEGMTMGIVTAEMTGVHSETFCCLYCGFSVYVASPNSLDCVFL